MRRRYALTNSERFIRHLRSKGVTIGKGCRFFGIKDLHIDLTRPSLIEIGNNVILTRGVLLLTHGFDWEILRVLYGEIIGFAKPIKIKDNVFIGTWAKIMPGVTIGENSIVAAGSLVSKNVTPNSIVAGVPATKIMNIHDYYERRKSVYIKEAKYYPYSIWKNLRRMPVPEDFREFFPLFLERNTGKFGKIPVKFQTDTSYEKFMRSKPLFSNLKSF